MNLPPDFLRIAGQYQDSYKNAEMGFQNSLISMSSSIARTTALLDILNDSLSFLYVRFSLMHYRVAEGGVARENGQISEKSAVPDEDTTKAVKSEDDKTLFKQAGEHFKSISTAAEEANKLVKASKLIGGLPKSIEKLGKSLDLIENVAKGFESTMKIGSALSGESSLTDALEGVVGVAASFSSILEVGEIASGPIGIAVMAGIALAGIGMTYYHDEQHRQEKAIADKQNTTKSLKTFEMQEQAAASYLSHGIDDMAQHAHKAARKKQHKWSTGYNASDANRKKYGQEAYAINIPVAMAVSDNSYRQPNLPPGIYRQSEDKMPALPKSYLEQTMPLQNELRAIAMTKGIDAFKQRSYQAIADANNYDQKHRTKTEPMVVSAIKEITNTVFTEVNGKKMVPDVVRHRKVHVQENGRRAAGASIGGRTVIINLNKPMIEHFTINTKETKEGINDFKRKVEQVLIEILNNAN